MNQLFLGDCLNVLREHIPDESVDLVYIDPPFNSKRDYNLFFDDKEIRSQRVAFEDTWTLKNINDSLIELHTIKTEHLYKLLMIYQEVAHHAFPYLVMMALRVFELHRVLKSTGSFYLHCDPAMSHYLKTVCDVIFHRDNYRNEITWVRSNPKSNISRNFPNCTDIILRYTKSDNYTYHQQYGKHNPVYIKSAYKYHDKNGQYRLLPLLNPNDDRPNLTYEFLGVTRVWRWTKERMQQAYEEGMVVQVKPGAVPQYKKYLHDSKGKTVTNHWADILQASGSESLGYPTQKPKALLERIISASSNEGDFVLDAFCGCGTTVDAAEGLHRQWIGIDISPVAIALIKRRLKETYGEHVSIPKVEGVPVDLESAKALWESNPFAFQDWWLTELGVFSATLGTKGADKGIDGVGLYMVGTGHTDTVRAAFQVKGGKVHSKDIDALIGAMSKHDCQLGVFLTTHPPTKPMLETVAGQGFVNARRLKLPKVQILTLKEYFAGKRPNLPSDNITFKAAKRKSKERQAFLLG